VAAGDYNQRISLQGPQEVRSVASSFNEMVERVQASQQAQRDFLANVSHELRTPLTSIQGFAQAIAEGAAAGQAGKEAARVIHRESDRLRRLVEELLDLARIESGQIAFAREPVELGQVLQGVCKRLALRAEGQGVTLQAELPELPVVIGDGDRLAQVFTNLLDNAIKHSPSESVVRLHGEVSRGWVTLHVDDRGMGIPEEELARIFERFYQVDKARGGDEGRGVGLGLAISQEIVQAHGGRIVVQSAVGDGTRFTVQLPVALPEDDTLVRGRTEEQAAGYLQGSRERSE
jgi:signal transduction histidine kinase